MNIQVLTGTARESRNSNVFAPSGVLQFILLAIKGAIVGTGAILPGISGGVLLVAFGIYEPMMALLSHPIKSLPKYYKMFIPFLIGWAAGFVLLARFVEMLFAASSAIALMLFAGLILGTVPELIAKSAASDVRGESVSDKYSTLVASPARKWSVLVMALAGFFLLFSVLAQGETMAITPTAPWFVFCGLVWGLSLVIPGLSSSSLLIFMGLYTPMTAGIAALNPAVILPLLGGLIITVALTARLVDSLITNHYGVISKVIIGIMLASTLLIIPTKFESLPVAAASILCFILGFLVARGMDMAREKTSKK